jgi:hypothetical protein
MTGACRSVCGSPLLTRRCRCWPRTAAPTCCTSRVRRSTTLSSTPVLWRTRTSMMTATGRSFLVRVSMRTCSCARATFLACSTRCTPVGGWTTVSRFEDSSPFEHDATLEHPFLGHTDVHRWFPGIGCEPEAAFDRLWADRHTVHIAGYPCAVPAVTAQRLLLLVHAARGPVDGNADVRRTWDSATPAERAEVERLAVDLKATVALAAATGRLDQVKGDRSRELWQLLSSGDSRRVALWWAVVKSARTPWQATRASVRLAVPRRAVLRLRLGRPATRREVAGAYFTQARLGATELGAALRRDRLRP